MSNELTYAQASKRLKELQYAKAQMGQLSIKDEVHKKALEIALPILEQRERGCQQCGGTGMADSGGTQPWGEQILIECDCKFEQQERGEGGWIDWGGGERPVTPGNRVDLKLRGGVITKDYPAECARWSHHKYNNSSDIIAYRIIPERATNQNGEQ